jgi:hypothetical protein
MMLSRSLRTLAITAAFLLGACSTDSAGGPDDATAAKDDEGPYCAPYMDCGAATDPVADEAAAPDEAVSLPDEVAAPEEEDVAVEEEDAADADEPDEEDVEVSDDAEQPTPRIKVTPSLMDFGYIQAGITATLPFQIKSVGTQALSVSKITLKGPASLTMLVGFEGKKVGDHLEYKIQPAKLLKVGDAIDGQVQFKPTTGDVVEAEARVFSNDPTQPDGAPMFILGNKKVPCVEFVPSTVEVTPTVVGTTTVTKVRFQSCSPIATVVYDPTLDGAGMAAGLSLDFSDFPGGVAPTLAKPLTMIPGEYYTLKVVYAPTKASPAGPDGKPIAKKYQVSFGANTFDGAVFLPVTVVAVDAPCSTPVIKVTEGTEVDIGTLVHLSGKASFSPFAPIAEYSWAVDQPEENAGSMIPSMAAPEPAFLVGVPGTYTFRLRVTDELGNESCQEASATVTAATQNRMTAILTWTPANPINPVPPNLGPDIDLHFIHPKAFNQQYSPDSADLNPVDGVPDGWFDTHWDCFWYNKLPNTNPDFKFQWWTFQSPYIEEDTKLLFDSQDGSGPEMLEQGLEFQKVNVYRLGVHFFDDYGYGPAYATIRIYMSGSLVHQQTVLMGKFDLWDVATLQCTAGDGANKCTNATLTVKPGPVVLHGYQNPAFYM